MENRPILVDDDEASIRLTLREALESEEHPVRLADSGEAALEAVAEEPPALVLLDLRLPGMDGMEVLRRLAHDRPEIPVVVITAHGSVENAIEAIRTGARGFIEKPFGPGQIRGVVAHALDREQQAAERARSYEEHLGEAAACLEGRRLDSALEHARRALVVDATRPEAFKPLIHSTRPTPTMSSILIVTPDEAVGQRLQQAVEVRGFQAAVTPSLADARSAEPTYALLFLDLAPEQPLDVVRDAVVRRLAPSVVVLVEQGGVERGLEAIARGAVDFVQKPITPEEVDGILDFADGAEREDREAQERMRYEEHLQEARASIRAGRLRAAADHARMAVALDAARPEAFNLLGVAQQLQGRVVEAQKYYRTALAVQSGYRPAQVNQANLSHSPASRNLGRFDLG